MSDPTQSEERDDTTHGEHPQERSGKPGAEGGSESPSADTLPGLPSNDRTALGDTDQHSDA